MKKRSLSSEENVGSKKKRERDLIITVKIQNFFAENGDTLKRKTFERCCSEDNHSYWEEIHMKCL